MNTYRVRVITDRNSHVVDVQAVNEFEATNLALDRYRSNGISAKCVGLTEELERHGLERAGREHFA